MTRAARSSLVACLVAVRVSLLGTALAAAAGAQDGVAGTLRTIDGRSWSGSVSVQDGKVVVRGDAAANAPEALDLATISGFEPTGATAAAVTTPHRLWLRSGLELPIVRVGGRAAADGKPALVAVETAGGIRFEVPLGSVRAIRHGGADRPEPTLFRADLDDGIMACLDATTGDLKWKDGKYGHGQALLVAGLLLVMAENGDVVLVDPKPDALHELTRFQALTDKTWNPPALAGEFLLVRNDKEAACFRLPVAGK